VEFDDDGKALHVGQGLDGDRWLRLHEAARIVLRHAATAREYAVNGPAKVLPCRDGHEEVLLAEGEFRASPGGGARPGAMVVVATPLGTLQYGNADLTVRATSRASELDLNSGSAWLEAGSGARVVGRAKLIGPEAKGRIVKEPNHSATGAVGRCEAKAKEAEAQALDLIKKPQRDGVGAAAAKHMRLRSAARRACRVAESALQLAPEPKRQPLNGRISAANAAWQRIPNRPSAEQK
jgi:hypothetical protein